MNTPEEKRYECYHVEWHDKYEFYVASGDVMWKGEPLGFNRYSEFLEFMAALTEDEKLALGAWRLEDLDTNEFVTINDGIFDEMNLVSLEANRPE